MLDYYTTPLIMPKFNFVTLDTCIIVLNILGKNNFKRGWNKVLGTNLNLQNIHPELFILVLVMNYLSLLENSRTEHNTFSVNFTHQKLDKKNIVHNDEIRLKISGILKYAWLLHHTINYASI
jgi:hypothetical protein